MDKKLEILILAGTNRPATRFVRKRFQRSGTKATLKAIKEIPENEIFEALSIRCAIELIRFQNLID